jgi:hypothetical protein
MAIDKLIPQYLNSDTDQKLVKSVEMTDNLNVRVSNNAEGTAGVIKNVKGTEVVSAKTAQDAFPAGDNRVIGSVANEKNKEILFFVWNNSNNHGIYRLDIQTDSFEKVYEDAVLNFQKLSFVDCDVVINDKEETLLYWTDNVNPPMKLNVNRALSNGYPSSLTSGTDEEKLLNLTVAKQPPLQAPTYNIVNNPDLGYNNISNKVFQFAYKYIYIDGEVSALSEYSTAAVSAAQLKDGIVDDDALNFFNQINIFVRNTVQDVKEIVVYARIGNEGSWFEVEKIDNAYNTNAVTVVFRNDKTSLALSKDEVNKLFDNVPQKAKSLSITNNRLFYGNYTEGYENIDLDVDSSPVYRVKPIIHSIKTDIKSSTPYKTDTESSSSDFNFGLDFSEVPSTVKAGSVVKLDFTLVVTSLDVTADSSYNNMFVAYEVPVTGKGEVTDIVRTDDISINEWNLPLESIVFKHSIDIDTDTSRADFISDVSDLLSNSEYYSVIDSNVNDKEQSNGWEFRTGGSNPKSRVWVAGKASFKVEKSTLTGSNQEFFLHFSGAEIYAKRLTKGLDFSGISFLPDSETPVEVVKSSTLVIGGTSGYNKYPAAPITSTAEYQIAGFSGNSSFVADNISGYKSFKENASHDFGIVYMDDRGRAGGVNKLDSVEITPLHTRSNTYGSLVDFRINHNAPSWASKWQMVYADNNGYNNFIQYSVSRAMPAYSDAVSATTDRIYISMSTLEGKPNSYKEQTGASIEYKYEEGDRLRVIRYEDDLGNYEYPANYNFKVLAYEYISDTNDSPFLVPPSYQKSSTGWFLVVESKDIPYFSFNSVLSGNSKWEDNVLVEIYNPKKEVEEKVYYGLGKTYDISGTSHYGDRDVTTPASAILTIDGAGGITSSDRMYVGDTIDVGGTTITIESVFIEPDGTYSYTYRGVVSAQPTASYLIGNYENAVVTVNQGDVYFRIRKIRKSNTYWDDYFLDERFENNVYAYDIDFVEDYSVSDFFTSKDISRGKPYAYIPESRTVRRKSSITYSDAYVLDSDRLNLSSFNASLANWTDLDIHHGGIDRLVSRGDALTVLQESKTSQVPIGRNLIEYANGDAGVSVSKNVLGTPSYYAGDFGSSGNPESVVERFGVVYFTDLNSRKVIRLSADGITPISDKGLDSFFQKLFEDLDKNVATPKIVGGFDPDNGEYIITVEDFSDSTITVQSSDPELEPTVYEIEIDEDGNYTPTPTYTSTQVVWNNINFNWNVLCQDWDEVGNGYLEIDGVFYIDATLQGGTGTVTILVTDAANSFVGVAQYNLGTGIVTMPSQTCTQRNITTNFGGAESAGVTISYKHKEGVWASKYSFMPSNYANIGNALYSFFDNDNGLVWRHNVNDTRNLIYGVQYGSMFEVVSNYNPSMIKTYQAMGIEGGGTWTSIIENSTQKTSISGFDKREGHQYAMIPRDTINSKSHQVYLGVAESVGNNKVTFTTPVNRLPFIIGESLKVASGNSLNTTGLTIVSLEDRKTIVCSGNGINVGDNVFVEHDSIVDGDPIRDVYASIKLTSDDTEPFEVHAVSVHYDRSMLHNERVN